jgi:hypothetical protein
MRSAYFAGIREKQIPRPVQMTNGTPHDNFSFLAEDLAERPAYVRWNPLGHFGIAANA